MSEGEHPDLPETCGTAFKEWAGVCDALADGRQWLILRKGGIEEGPGPGAFRPEHNAFWLYPTAVHQAQQGLKPSARREADADRSGDPGTVGVEALAVVRLVRRVESLEVLRTLDPLHVWTAETVEKRFHYRTPGLWVLGVRVYRRDPPVRIPNHPGHAGCKTWVPLDAPISTAGLAPVLPSETFGRRLTELHEALGRPR
jgi:hypothetical protein